MHIVSIYAQEKGKICRTGIYFYDDKPPFDQIKIKNESIVQTQGKRARAVLATDLRQTRLTQQQLNTLAVIIDG